MFKAEQYHKAMNHAGDVSQTVIRHKLRAIIYCRVSTDKQEQDGESLEYQKEKCTQYAELHDINVILVLKEAKSGFIHYSLREKLTLARQMIRDGLADVIIVWDLRRFSRNFVHSAMIFEEIENAGGQIVSVSENIDNSLTGKLIRSILAWSAESEREKIIEYANRHWQTRLGQNLPVAGGQPPFGWAWKNENKAEYVIDKEEAAVRLAIFEMFVNLDMSVRRIVHKLTEDGILSPTASRERRKTGNTADSTEEKASPSAEPLPSATAKKCKRTKNPFWSTSTVHSILRDERNIGILRIGKTNHAVTEEGRNVRIPNPQMKTIPGGIPAIISVEIYELAQMKLKNNKADKSHLHQKPEDFLLKSHVFCKTCGYSASSYYSTCGAKPGGKRHVYPFYGCRNKSNKYAACPDLPSIRTSRVDQLVWEDCCQVFERLEMIRDTLAYNIEQSLQNILEDTTGRQHIDQLQEEIRFAGMDLANGFGQLVRGHILEQIAHRPGLDRLEDIILVIKGGQDDDARARIDRSNSRRGLHAVLTRHLNVHQHHVRPLALPLQFGIGPDSLCAIARLRHHLKARLQLQHSMQALTHQGLVLA